MTYTLYQRWASGGVALPWCTNLKSRARGETSSGTHPCGPLPCGLRASEVCRLPSARNCLLQLLRSFSMLGSKFTHAEHSPSVYRGSKTIKHIDLTITSSNTFKLSEYIQTLSFCFAEILLPCTGLPEGLSFREELPIPFNSLPPCSLGSSGKPAQSKQANSDVLFRLVTQMNFVHICNPKLLQPELILTHLGTRR